MNDLVRPLVHMPRHPRVHCSVMLVVIIPLYFILLLVLAPTRILSFDTYYYWDWSRHLALSYYDGSPMIAYFIKISTLLFGDTLFALGLVGIVTTALTGLIVYKTARLFLHKEASVISLFLWLFSPLVTLDLLNQTTYDTPLTLFWALTLYYSMKYIKHNKPVDLYGIGMSIGLMLLSKYSGIVLVFSFAIFLLTSHYRTLLKSYHVYLALLLAMVMFSPVLLWNYQHQWLSFLYQLNTHQVKEASHPLWNVFHSFFTIFLPSLNFLLIAPAVCWIKSSARASPFVYLCLIISTTFVCFYLLVASIATIRGFWLGQFLISASLLAGYCYQEFRYRKSTNSLIVAYVIISLVMVLGNTSLFHFTYSKKFAYVQWIQAFNRSQTLLPSTVITTGWFEARMLFFLKNKPTIYTLECGTPQNQYALWSVENNRKMMEKTLASALYIDTYDRSACIKKYFDRCEPLASPSVFDKHGKQLIFAYRCSNALFTPNHIGVE